LHPLAGGQGLSSGFPASLAASSPARRLGRLVLYFACSNTPDHDGGAIRVCGAANAFRSFGHQGSILWVRENGGKMRTGAIIMSGFAMLVCLSACDKRASSTDLSSVESRLDDLESKVESLESAKDDLETAKDELETKVSSLESDKDDLDIKVMNLGSELENLRIQAILRD